mgnify:CR=1 FL=1
MAALGLLTGCRWDDDSAYAPERRGFYLRVDSALYWVPEGRTTVYLPYEVQSITGTEKHLWALSTDGHTLWGFRAGSTKPQYSELLPYSVATLASTAQQLYACGPSHTGQASLRGKGDQPGLRWQWASSMPVSVLAAGSSFTGAAGENRLLVLLPGEAQASFSEVLPGPVQHLWVETPTGLGGTFRWKDTLYSFRYEPQARLLRLDTTQPTPYRKKLYSPYLKAQFGTEYLGTVSLSVQGVLFPLSLTRVEEVEVSFFDGKAFVLRQDSLLEYALTKADPPRLIGVFPSARTIAVVPVYRYGSAEITTR